MARVAVLGLLVVMIFAVLTGEQRTPRGVDKLKRIPSSWELTDPLKQRTIEAGETLMAYLWEQPAAAVADSGWPIEDTTLRRPPSMSAAQIDAVLASYSSPAEGSGEAFYAFGVAYVIDPAYALAFFVVESSAGTNPSWAGWKPDGSTTYNVGNIICAGYDRCYGRFRDYRSWAEGIEDWYRLISVEYIDGRGLTTFEEVLPIYAPSHENDVNGYTEAVRQLVVSWRRSNQQTASAAVAGESAPIATDPSGPFGYNVRSALNANDGALRRVVIQPGQTFSFNATVGDPSYVLVMTYGGVPGGGWCDLAARYVQSVRPLLPPSSIEFVHHGVQLNAVSWEDSVSIWNIDGTAGSSGGRQDLIIRNTLDRPIEIEAIDDGTVAVIRSRVLLDVDA